MTNKMTFREFVKNRYGSKLPNYSQQSAFSYLILSLENDETFPDNEVDGLEIRKYIRRKQMEKELYDKSMQVLSFNRGVIHHFECLWDEYKEFLKK